MKVVITDFFVGDCEWTQKSDVEVVRVQLNEQPELVIAATELIRWLRFTKRQFEKTISENSRD